MSLPRARPSVHMLSTSPVATDSANLEEDGSQGQAWIVPMTLGYFHTTITVARHHGLGRRNSAPCRLSTPGSRAGTSSSTSS
jgi:hypothetical protein